LPSLPSSTRTPRSCLKLSPSYTHRRTAAARPQPAARVGSSQAPTMLDPSAPAAMPMDPKGGIHLNSNANTHF